MINKMLGLVNLRLMHKHQVIENNNELRIAKESLDVIKKQEQNYKDIIKDTMAIKWNYLHEIDELKYSDVDITCTICGYKSKRKEFPKKNSECSFQGGKIERYECPNCGLIFGSRIFLALSQEEVANEYKMIYCIYSEGDTTEYEMKTFFSLNPKKNKTYLNFGAGQWSKSLQILRDQGYDIWGYEPYSSNSTLEYIISDIEDLKKHKFDGLISHNLIEHLFNPIESFELFKNLLNGDSLMAHSTACYKYKYDFSRFHVHFFTGNSLNVLCDKVDLKIYDRQEDTSVGYINYVFGKN